MKVETKKIIIYSAVPAVAFVAASLSAYFGLKMTAVWSVFVALASAVVVLAITRFGWNLKNKTITDTFLNSLFWNFIVFVGLAGLCLASSANVQKLWIAIVCYAVLSSFAADYLLEAVLKNDEKTVETSNVTVESLRQTLRYKYLNDSLSPGIVDVTRPLCYIGGKALTVEEAMAQGYGSIASDGINYINSLFK